MDFRYHSRTLLDVIILQNAVRGVHSVFAGLGKLSRPAGWTGGELHLESGVAKQLLALMGINLDGSVVWFSDRPHESMETA